jgi:hypothetical protein
MSYLCLHDKLRHIFFQSVFFQGLCKESKLLCSNFLFHIIHDARSEGRNVKFVDLQEVYDTLILLHQISGIREEMLIPLFGSSHHQML